MTNQKNSGETKIRVISKNRKPAKYSFPKKKEKYDNGKEIKDIFYGIGMLVVGIVITIININNPETFSNSKAIGFRALPIVGVIGIIAGIGLVIVCCVKISENNEKRANEEKDKKGKK